MWVFFPHYTCLYTIQKSYCKLINRQALKLRVSDARIHVDFLEISKTETFHTFKFTQL